MKFHINNLVWCVNIIAFSHLFRDAEKGSIWRYVAMGFILAGFVVLSIY